MGHKNVNIREDEIGLTVLVKPGLMKNNYKLCTITCR